jgi:hypothetical protein
MSPTASDEMVEVRLRYRPVGDVLTLVVPAGDQPGPHFSTEPSPGAMVEWVQLPDGSARMVGIQLIEASSRTDADGRLPELPEALRSAALDLMHPGHRHHDHPSSHRPTHPTSAHDIHIRTSRADVTSTAGLGASPVSPSSRQGPTL